MKKRTKLWLIAAGCLVLAGGILFVIVMSGIKWDFAKLSTAEYETNTHEIKEEFDSISVNTDTADVIIAPSDDAGCRVECCEEEKAQHSVSVEDNRLVIKINNERSWYDYIGLRMGMTKITVYLPVAEYKSLYIDENTGNVEVPDGFLFEEAEIALTTGDVKFASSVSDRLKMSTSTGNILMENASAGSVDLSVTTGDLRVTNIECKGDVRVFSSTGKTYLTDVMCQNLVSDGSTGDIFLNHVMAAEKFSIERMTGDVKLDGSDAGEIVIKTTTGDVTGTLLSEKIFAVKSNTGDEDVPDTTTGGRCKVDSQTGNIEIKIE